MLDLDSPLWANYDHAYGNAAEIISAPRSWTEASGFGDYEAVPGIPSLLRQLELKLSAPDDGIDAEPWMELWSSLCHQGDIYTASYAAVPHLMRIAFSLDEVPNWQFFALTTSIEIARQTGRGPAVPTELSEDYYGALQRLHDLAYKISGQEWDELLSRCISAALVAVKGHAILAETIAELSPELIREVRIHSGLEGDDEE